jgi:ABC-type transporter Mla MlaB component
MSFLPKQRRPRRQKVGSDLLRLGRKLRADLERPGYYLITQSADPDPYTVWKRLSSGPDAAEIGRFPSIESARASVPIEWRPALSDDPFICYGWEPAADVDRALEVSLSKRGDIASLACVGPLDATGGMHLVDAVQASLDDHVARVTIDCSGISDADDEGIHFLADAVTSCHAAGVEVELHLPPVLNGHADVSTLHDLVRECGR